MSSTEFSYSVQIRSGSYVWHAEREGKRRGEGWFVCCISATFCQFGSVVSAIFWDKRYFRNFKLICQLPTRNRASIVLFCVLRDAVFTLCYLFKYLHIHLARFLLLQYVFLLDSNYIFFFFLSFYIKKHWTWINS